MLTIPSCNGAKADGLRSRAAYKLLEIDDKDHLLRPGMAVADPARRRVRGVRLPLAASARGRVFALDLLPVDPPRVSNSPGRLFDDEVLCAGFERQLGGRKVDLVLSISPPTCPVSVGGPGAVDLSCRTGA